ncbi:MAG: CYTH domain-containing protein [Alphaproteobacteria bacterium]|nr:CYTH domain-containing protein [Alphaproteobacteria bacterium]
MVSIFCFPNIAKGRTKVRIENEFKLSVPDDRLEAVRMYLREMYGSSNGSILREFGNDFTSRISDERFIDRYFDTPDLYFISAESGVRHRQHWNLSDPSNYRKEGKQLLQLKLSQPNDYNSLNRTEIKFKINRHRKVKFSLNRHPLLDLVKQKDRSVLISFLKQFNIDAHEMRTTITVEQRRWRIYIFRKDSKFITFTLDEVKSRWNIWRIKFVELEIELNEIAYTKATTSDRAEMEQFSHRIVDDLLVAFPSIEQNQTPKYNKVFHAFSERIPNFRSIVFYGTEVLTVILIVGMFMTVLVVAGIWRVRNYYLRKHRAKSK